MEEVTIKQRAAHYRQVLTTQINEKNQESKVWQVADRTLGSALLHELCLEVDLARVAERLLRGERSLQWGLERCLGWQEACVVGLAPLAA